MDRLVSGDHVSLPTPKALVIICAAGAALLAWILYSPVPRLIIWPDSIGYMGPAVDAIEGGAFSHWYGRGSAYPFWLWALLTLAPEPGVVIAGQRLLVLATYLCLATSMVLVGRHAGARRPAESIPIVVAAAFWLLVFVLYPPVAGLPHIVMPEVLFSFVLSVLLLGVVAHTLPDVATPYAVAAGMVGMLASVALVLVKPHWLLGALLTPVALLVLAPPARRRWAGYAVAAAFGAAVVVLIVPEWRLQQRFDSYNSRVFGARSLFCNSGDLVHEFLAGRRVDAFAIDVDDALARMLTPEARAQARDWTLLGFNGDQCMYGEAAVIIAKHFGGRSSAEVAYYFRTYFSALARRPWYLASRLGRHYWSLSTRPFNAVSGRYFLHAEPDVLAASRDVRPLFRRWFDDYPATFSGTIELPTRPWLFGLRVFFALAGLLMAAGTAIAAWLSVAGWRSLRERPIAVVFLAVLWCLLAMNALIATVHTFEPRYLAMQVPLFALLGFVSSLVVVRVLVERRRGV